MKTASTISKALWELSVGTEQDRRWPSGQVKGSVTGEERKPNKTENVGRVDWQMAKQLVPIK